MIRILLNGEIFIEEYVSWQEISSVISRSQEYHGVIIAENLDIRLIQSAYTFVDNLDNLSDVAAVCTCVIQSHTSIDGWKDEFNGLLDFTTLKRDNQGATKAITISAYSNDFANKILERSETEIPYDRLETLDGGVITPFANEYQSVDIDGVDIKSTGLGTGNDVYFFSTVNVSSMILGLDFESDNPDINSVAFKNLSTTGTEDRTIADCFYVSQYASTVIIDFTLDFIWSLASGATAFNIYIDQHAVDGDGNFIGNFLDRVGIQVLSLGTYSEYVSYTFTLAAGEVISIRTQQIGGTKYNLQTLSTSVLNVTVYEKSPTTPCNFVPPFEMGQRVIESITGQASGLDAPIFGRTDSPVTYTEDGEGALIFGTNGKLIRQFPIGYITTDEEKKAQLSYSFSDWFNNYDKILCLGAGVKYEGGQYKLYVDDRKEFYKNELVYTVTELEVDTFESEKMLELYYSEVEVGSNYQKLEEIGALEEYNSKQKYSTPVLNENKLDLLTKWIYAAYPFEAARRQAFIGTETTDYKLDNDNFMFQTYRDGGFVQWSAQDFAEINGLTGLTTYINLTITPQRVLRERFGWLINTGFRGYQSDELKYNVSDIVTDLSTRRISEGDVIVENSNIPIQELESPKFTGRRIRFSAPVSSDTFTLLQNNPYGIVKYPDPLTEIDGYMYLDEVSTTLIDKKTNWEGREITGFSEEGAFRLLQDGSYRLLETGGRRLLE
jgi:hypothetical protein